MTKKTEAVENKKQDAVFIGKKIFAETSLKSTVLIP